MQEKKNKRLALSLLVLLGLTFMFYFFSWKRGQPEIDPALFRVDEQSQIDRVLFESSSGKLELRFDGTRWRVNDTYDADRQLIQVLFATLDQAEPKRPVSSNLTDSISSLLTRQGVRVSLFEQGQLKEKFTAGGNDAKTESWFRHDDEVPYIMVIPGYRAYVSYVLELKENDWRDKRIFNFNWRNFKSLKTISRDPAQDFEVTFADRFFTIQDMTAVDTTRLNDFLDAVSLLAADQIMAELPDTYDSLVKSPPALEVTIQDISEHTYSLQLWPPMKRGSQVPGRLSDGNWVLFRPEKITAIARKKAFFSQSLPH